MIEITRQEFKRDPDYMFLHAAIKENHKIADHTIKVLTDNKHIKDFCEEARHFLMIVNGKKGHLYIHYDVSSWYDKKGALIRIDNIAVYDDFIEYEASRVKQLNGAGNGYVPNIN